MISEITNQKRNSSHMKTVKLTLGILVIVIAFAFTLVQSTNWKIKEDAYSITFKGSKVDGTIKGVKAKILFDEDNPGKSKILASIDVNTLNTGNSLMNKHAKSESGLDSKVFPFINFESILISGKSDNYNAKGKLTIKGITKEISLPFTIQNKGTEAVFIGKLSIVPKDYNITRFGTPDLLEIGLTIPVTK